jgi:Tfp pilus assembly protein PilO
MADEQWHLDKRVPVAIIFAILIQTAGAVWWASNMTERMDQIERRMDNAAQRSQNIDNLVASQATQIAVLVARIDEQTRQIAETNTLLRDYLRKNGGGQ